ncbi:MAG: putative HTH-type transcriptional regulator [Alphaproteobacteria bacterium ADurb.Bin438]|nr:MAG: putative HTH-type transcriptional regulator [Alphaproteobacteria bacterium ADurb.Bin438]
MMWNDMNKIKDAIKKSGLTIIQVAEKTGTTHSTISKLQNGINQLTVEWIEKLSKAIDCSPLELLPDEWQKENPNYGKSNFESSNKEQGFAEIEIISAIACCGNGNKNYDIEIIGKQLISILSLKEITNSKPENIKILKVRGDSMTPTINDSDLIWVDISYKTPTGDGLYLFIVRDELMVKRIRFNIFNNTATITSDNQNYPPIETNKTDEITVIGKVISISKMLG